MQSLSLPLPKTGVGVGGIPRIPNSESGLALSSGNGRDTVFNPRAYKVFLEFFRDELSSPPAVSSNCVHIPYKHFDAKLVSIGYYGYDI